ncbi:hypothetical protein EG329_008617 [Mollisiaceae sp. DMI_Dod_QoI]|nr:hypothetical protein EG329_008617 [Helotiales sp. DMI_Dod_QoI]
MATQDSPDTIFYKSLDRFKIGLTDREREDFELTSLDEVHTVVLEIQNEQASERKMQDMTRRQSFLEGMEQYSNVIEVFLDVSMFVAFVWGPVKFLLQVAKTWTDSLDLLLNAYEQVGETIPQLLQYDKLFSQNTAMQRVLGLIYQDILEFHRRALFVFKRRSWKRIFHSTWKTFNTHFSRLLQNLHRHKIDIERQASLIEIEQSQAQRESQEKNSLLKKNSKGRGRQSRSLRRSPLQILI